MKEILCPVCFSTMHNAAENYYICQTCKYMACEELPGSGAEVESLDVVREKNFNRILEILKSKFNWCKTIIDIGCSHGLFLKIAAKAGFSVTGLEPDAVLAEESNKIPGASVVTGFFPDAPGIVGKKFDVLIFNDSFEHIPDINSVIAGIKRHLNDNGIVAINLPSSSGLMFNIAFLLYKFGLSAPFKRLWQKGFASPHLHYFNCYNLRKLFENNDFYMCCSMPLSYYTLKGLWKRLVCKSSFLISVAAWGALTILYPLFAIKSDCFVAFFSLKKRGA
jgi:SAM-dependent methyltransferase